MQLGKIKSITAILYKFAQAGNKRQGRCLLQQCWQWDWRGGRLPVLLTMSWPCWGRLEPSPCCPLLLVAIRGSR